MATNTPNYQLRKPAVLTDVVSVTLDFNNNWDILDTELKEVSDSTTLDRPIAQLRNTTITSIPNNAFTAVVFQAEDKDSHNGHDAGVNPTRWTCPSGQSGFYEIAYMVTFAARISSGTSDVRAAQLRKSGSVVSSSGNLIRALDNGVSQPSVKAGPVGVQIAAGEFIEVFAFQNSGSALDTHVSTDYVQSYMTLKWVRSS